MLLVTLYDLPIFQHLVGGVRFYAAEDVRVAMHQLFTDIVCHTGNIKLPRLCGDLRVKHHLKQHVSQLLAHQLRVIGIYRLNYLICLLNKTCPDALVRLLAIPRTSALTAEYLKYQAKVVKRIAASSFADYIFDFFLLIHFYDSFLSVLTFHPELMPKSQTKPKIIYFPFPTVYFPRLLRRIGRNIPTLPSSFAAFSPNGSISISSAVTALSFSAATA